MLLHCRELAFELLDFGATSRGLILRSLRLLLARCRSCLVLLKFLLMTRLELGASQDESRALVSERARVLPERACEA